VCARAATRKHNGAESNSSKQMTSADRREGGIKRLQAALLGAIYYFFPRKRRSCHLAQRGNGSASGRCQADQRVRYKTVKNGVTIKIPAEKKGCGLREKGQCADRTRRAYFKKEKPRTQSKKTEPEIHCYRKEISTILSILIKLFSIPE